MSNFKLKKEKTSVIKTEIYELTDIVDCELSFTDGIENRRLIYTGENKYISPLYKEDISLLKTKNPFYDNYDWFETNIPSLEDLDTDNIILYSSYNHSFYNKDGNPLGCVYAPPNCYGFVNGEYRLEELYEYLTKNPLVLDLKEIEEVPYYNNSKGCRRFIDCKVYASSEILQLSKKLEVNYKDLIFGVKHVDKITNIDYLGIKQFRK